MVSAAVLTVSLASPAVADRGGQDFGRATLTGFASLPAETFVPGSEPSGSAIGAAPSTGSRRLSHTSRCRASAVS